jgi:hypothetical protein
MRVYIESTIPSYIVARQTNDLVQSAHQCVTRDWWDSRRFRHELFTSQVVLDEISRGDATACRLRAEVMNDVPILELTPAASELAVKLLCSRLLPQAADRDAMHIALASVHQLDVLLTWNCRHIANPFIQSPLQRLVESAGYKLPVLCTPDDLMEQEN